MSDRARRGPSKRQPGSTPSSVLCLMGPTAVGKTDVAMRLFDAIDCELISVDSAQVYRGLDIGSAKPDPETLARYPHALIDIRDPDEVYSAADFVRDADAAVREALARDKLPVLVGGTMLYFRSFRDGIAELPSASPELRARLTAEAAAIGWPAMHARLTERDPASAAAIHPNNHQRLLRALEVLELTGAGLQAQWSQASAGDRLGVSLIQVGLVPSDRAELHRRINVRFSAMLEAGLIAEVRELLARFDGDLPALRAVGYRQVAEHLAGAYPHEALLERGSAATRQLAKRQLTWLRGWPDLVQLTPAPADELAAAVLQTLGVMP